MPEWFASLSPLSKTGQCAMYRRGIDRRVAKCSLMSPNMNSRPALLRWLVPLSLLGVVAPACAVEQPRLLIFGEQHDQPDQQRQVAEVVREAAANGRLGAVVIEMAEAGHDTTALPRQAGEQQVRDALHWQGWPWPVYAQVVMNAVRAGVPVYGGNLPRTANRAAMKDETLDARIGPAAHAAMAEAVRAGHCDLLPASQLPGMVRIQIARDRSMAGVVSAVLRSTAPRQVVLLTGAQHASRDGGVPIHLIADGDLQPAQIHVVMFGDSDPRLVADEWRAARFTPQPDRCAELARSLEAETPPASAAVPRSR